MKKVGGIFLMKKYFKRISGVMVLLFLSILCTSCIKNEGVKATGKEIVVWSSLTDKEVIELRKLAEKWGKETGNKVKVHSDKGDTKAYIGAVNSGMGPDIEFGVSHMKLEKLYSEKLLAEIPNNKIDPSKYLEQGMRTVIFDDKMYAVPLTMYTYALYYNKDKVAAPPETLEELLSKASQVGLQYDINNFYLSYSFLAAKGGYIFKNEKGRYDVHDIGLGNEGAQNGYAMLQDLTQKYKFMPYDIDSRTTRENFEKGTVGFYISGPWDIELFQDKKELARVKNTNFNFSVAPLPKWDGKPMPSLVNVQVAYVNAKSKNISESIDLMKYLAENSQLMMYKNTGKIPVLKSALEQPEIKKNTMINAFVTQARNGEAIPNVSEVQALQGVSESMKLLTSGKMTPKQYGEKVVDDINKFILKQKQR